MTDGPQALVIEAPLVKPKVGGEDWAMRAGLAIIGVYLLVAVALPLYAILS